MCRKVYICTDHSKWDTCRVEKMGCKGCYFSKNSNKNRVNKYLKRKEDNNEHV